MYWRLRLPLEIKLNSHFSWLLGGSTMCGTTMSGTQDAGSEAWALPDGKQL